MFLKQTFFGPEGVFVASPVPADMVQSSSSPRYRTDSESRRASLGRKASGISDGGIKPGIGFVSFVGKPSKETGSEETHYGSKRANSLQRMRKQMEWNCTEGGGAIGGAHYQPIVSSLSDLSAHPDAEENWYSVDNSAYKGRGDFLCRDTPSSCSLMEISPLATPKKEVAQPPRNGSFNQPLPAFRWDIKMDDGVCDRSSQRNSSETFSNYSGTSKVSPELLDMSYTKPTIGDISSDHRKTRNAKTKALAESLHLESCMPKSKSVQKSICTGENCGRQSKQKEVWFLYEEARPRPKRVTFSQDKSRPASREVYFAREPARVVGQQPMSCEGIYKRRRRPKEVSFADESANGSQRRPKEVTFAIDGDESGKIFRPNERKSRCASRSTSCCIENKSMIKSANSRRRTVSEGTEDSLARSLHSGSRKSGSVGKVSTCHASSCSEDGSPVELKEVDMAESDSARDTPSSTTPPRVCVTYEPLNDADAEGDSRPASKFTPPTLPCESKTTKDLHDSMSDIGGCENLPSPAAVLHQGSASVPNPAKKVLELKVSSPVLSSSAVNLELYPPSPYECAPPGGSRQRSSSAERPLPAATPTSKAVLRNSWNSADCSVKPPQLHWPHPQSHHFYQQPKPSSAPPFVIGKDGTKSDNFGASESASRAPHCSSGIGMPLSPPRESEKTGLVKKSHQAATISPYAVSVVNGLEPSFQESSLENLGFDNCKSRSSNIEQLSEIYDQLDDVTPRRRANSDFHVRTRLHSDSTHHKHSSGSHSKVLISNLSKRHIPGSKSDHNFLCGSQPSELSNYDMPSSAPAFLDTGQSQYRYPPSRHRKATSGHYQHHRLQVGSPLPSMSSPLCYLESPRLSIPLSPSQMSYLSSLSAHSNPSATSAGMKWAWPGGGGWVGSPSGAGGCWQHNEMLSPHSQQWWCSPGHFQLLDGVPYSSSYQLSKLLQALGVCVCVCFMVEY